MENLSSFLYQNAVKVENERYTASKRFVDADGNAVEWEIRCISVDEDEALKRSCTRRVPVQGKKGMYIPETDYNAYVGKLAAACTVYPDLNDAGLQDSYHVMGADCLLKKMLTPGEYSDYLARIQEMNGFTVSMEEMVNEAKN